MKPAVEETEQASESPDECSKCKGNLDTDGYPLWCKACRAKHQREYQALRITMTENRSFLRGVEAMRKKLMDGFEEMESSGAFNPLEVAYLIRQAQGPLPPVD